MKRFALHFAAWAGVILGGFFFYAGLRYLVTEWPIAGPLLCLAVIAAMGAAITTSRP